MDNTIITQWLFWKFIHIIMLCLGTSYITGLLLIMVFDILCCSVLCVSYMLVFVGICRSMCFSCFSFVVHFEFNSGLHVILFTHFFLKWNKKVLGWMVWEVWRIYGEENNAENILYKISLIKYSIAFFTLIVVTYVFAYSPEYINTICSVLVM